MGADIRDLIQRGDRFAATLRKVKEGLAPRDFEWYRYDSMGNLTHLDLLLTGAYRDLTKLAGDAPVLDFGCADGDFAFFLESLGMRVLAFDHGRTNHNGMVGVRALRQHLASEVQIHELDLDSNFELPAGTFGLAVMLGILYHLKNPFYVLESIARQTRYCLLSTRIARLLPDRKSDVSQVPMAYLLGETELNEDNSNFWIFSEAGLRRVLERSNWRVLRFLTVGDDQSDPVTIQHDQRAFCLLESTYGMRHFDLLSGWHQPESSGWRWTEREFGVRLEHASFLTLEMFMPAELIDRFGPVTLSAEANGTPLRPETFAASGKAVYTRRLPQREAEVTFRLSHAFPPSSADARELGIIVARLLAE